MYKSLLNPTKLLSLTKTWCAESILDSVKVAPLPFLHITSKKSDNVSHKREYVIKGKKDDGTQGERTIGIDSLKKQKIMFPDKNTPSLMFDGIPFSQLPICNIRVSPNNTIFALCEYTGLLKIYHTCGREGYKNAKKGTNIAAQQTGITFGSKVFKSGIKNVRVAIRGLGPGRASSIKGLEMSGLNIVSVTDTTRVSSNPPRPPKVRRI